MHSTGTRVKRGLYGPNKLEGACIDSVAEKTVIGSQQAEAYSRLTGRKATSDTTPLIFWLGDGERARQGTIEVRIPLPNGLQVAVQVHIVHADITLLIGMEIMCAEGLILEFGAGITTKRGGNWSLPMRKRCGHIFIEWLKRKICYTNGKLRKLHLPFLHTSADRLFRLIKKVITQQACGDLRNTIDNLTKECESCRKFSNRPFRLRAALPLGRIIFNHELAFDLIWLEKNPVLHIVNTHKHFQNDVLIRSKRAEDVWYTFVEGWT